MKVKMKKLKIYLDTSVINFAVSKQDVKSDKEATLTLLKQIRGDKFEAYISELVMQEIEKASETKQRELQKIIEGIPYKKLIRTDEIDLLAKEYIRRKVIAEKHSFDARHIASASVNQLDVIVSWNFEHMVKVKTKREVKRINLLMGYPEIDIVTPKEVIE